MRPTDNRFRPRHCQGDHLAAVARSASSVLREHHTSAEVVPSLDGGYLMRSTAQISTHSSDTWRPRDEVHDRT